MVKRTAKTSQRRGNYREGPGWLRSARANVPPRNRSATGYLHISKLGQAFTDGNTKLHEYSLQLGRHIAAVYASNAVSQSLLAGRVQAIPERISCSFFFLVMEISPGAVILPRIEFADTLFLKESFQQRKPFVAWQFYFRELHNMLCQS